MTTADADGSGSSAAEAAHDRCRGRLAFTALVIGNLTLIVSYRSGGTLWGTLRRPNPATVLLAADIGARRLASARAERRRGDVRAI